MNYHNINLRQFQQLAAIAEKHPEDNIKYAVAYLYGIPNLDALPLVEYTRLMKEAEFLNGEIPTNPLATSYKLNGRTYTVDMAPGNFTVAQYTDLTNYAQHGGQYADILSVVMIPEGHSYNDGYDMAQVRGDLLTMGICDCKAVTAFFLNWLRAYTKLAGRFLRRRTRRLPKEALDKVKTLLRTLESCPIF